MAQGALAAERTVADTGFDEADVVVVGSDLPAWAATARLTQNGVGVAIIDYNADPAGTFRPTIARLEHPYTDDRRALHNREIVLRYAIFGMLWAPLPVLLLGHRQECDRARARLGRINGIRVTLLEPDALAELEPSLRAPRWACKLESNYLVSPRQVTDACRARAEVNGAIVCVQEHAPRLVWEGASCRGVELSDGRRVTARAGVLVAAGGESATIINGGQPEGPLRAPSWEASLEIHGLRPTHELHEVSILGASGPARPSGDAPEPVPDRTAPRPPTTRFSLVPGLSGEQSVLGSTFFRVTETLDSAAARLLERGGAYFDGLGVAAVNARRMYAEPVVDDGLPLVGPVAGADSLFIVTGGDPRDMTIGVALAELAASAIFDGSEHATPAALRASRKMLR